ncbi:MAG: trypsin-like peptidase domain-containing protein [Candidatus Melainabacteria bacterium]|nr:trypsin-like peptidase domain-containing protein [Candidatus Melainabacteria bacterium]
MSKSKGTLLLSGASLAALVLIAMVAPEEDTSPSSSNAQAAQAAPVNKKLATPVGVPKTVKASPVSLTPDEKVNVSVYEKSYKAVVNIAPLQTAEQVYFYGHEAQQEGIGSGVVISAEGHLVTNNHVIGDSEAVKVTFFDGSSLPARVIGVDPSNDLAVLKIEAQAGKKFSFVEWGDSSNLQPGRRVFAIGNPFGLDHTMTAGIVSSLNRTFQTPNKRVIKGIIQTDAAINPGNSGGPLLDTQGKVIGITTAILSRSGSSSGIGLAIPSNITKTLVPELILHGVVRRPDLGIMVLHPEGVRVQTGVLAGLRVIQIDPKGPATEAGLRVPRLVNYPIGKTASGKIMYIKQYDRSLADLIVAVDNIQVRNVDDLFTYIEKKSAGQVVNLTVLRNDADKGPKITKIPVKLAVTRTD